MPVIQSQIIIPVIRRIMPNIIANQIIGVQPMAQSGQAIFNLQSKFIPSNTILQKNSLVYEFYSDVHPEIFDWLNDGCIWHYVVFTSISFRLSGRITTISFDDIKGSIEFKMRF